MNDNLTGDSLENNILMSDIQWYPGHMTKTRRQMKELVSQCDIVAELLDCRAPDSSQNPDIEELTRGRERIIVLNKADMADPTVTEKWVVFFKEKNINAVPVSSRTGRGLEFFYSLCEQIYANKRQKDLDRGLSRNPKILIAGIPNVGKSMFINCVSGSKKAKVENRPGVTRQKQWIRTPRMDLLDTPGVLWPKFDNQLNAQNLAFIGSIKDAILDTTALAILLVGRLALLYPERLTERYSKLTISTDKVQMLAEIGQSRGFVIRGGDIDYDRAALVLLDEFRNMKLGRISLEVPAGQ
jgi:ribosome biogenesis GTPase A